MCGDNLQTPSARGANDAGSAHTQVRIVGSLQTAQVTRERMPTSVETTTPSRRPNERDSIERDLQGHPSAGLLWEVRQEEVVANKLGTDTDFGNDPTSIEDITCSRPSMWTT